MIKHQITYEDIVDGQDTEINVQLRFAYTPPAIRLYEQQNPDSKFFVDYNKATDALSKYVKSGGFSAISKTDDESIEQYADMLPMLSDPAICDFMLKVVPCLYMEVHGGIRLQSEETWEDASESLWMMQLVNIPFFMQVFSELNGVAIAQSKASNKKKESDNLQLLSSIEPLSSVESMSNGQNANTLTLSST